MKMILLVDDSASVRTDLRQLLEKASYQVIEAADADQGIFQLRKNPDVALIICDVNMPGVSGLQMLANVKAANLTKAKIFMLTTEASPDLKAQAKDVGVSLWVTKPYDRDKLLYAVLATLK